MNVMKGGFPFASAHLVPALMESLERGPLGDYTPCHFRAAKQQAHAMAIVHAELMLVHPFHEGNGRCARLLAYAMARQCGFDMLDSSYSTRTSTPTLRQFTLPRLATMAQ